MVNQGMVHDEGLSAYYGYFLDENKIRESSSGGVATAISETVIDRGGIVFGCQYSEDFHHIEYGMAMTKDDLFKFKGSKYAESRKRIKINGEYVHVYKVVLEKLLKGYEILFIGLGCDVGGLKYFLEANNCGSMDRLLTIDLICHGSTFGKVHEDYVSMLEKKHNSSIKNFTLRYKKKGVVPNYIKADFANGDVHTEKFSTSDYGFAFRLLSKKSCYNCKFRGKNHPADITIGDYWGLEKDRAEYNKLGVSLILTSSCRGKDIINNLTNENFVIGSTDLDYVFRYNRNYFMQKKMDARWKRFKKALDEYGLHRAVRETRTIRDRRNGIMSSVKRHIPVKIKRLLGKK